MFTEKTASPLNALADSPIIGTAPVEPQNVLQGFLDLAGVEAPGDDLYYTCVRCGLCLESCPTYSLLNLEMASPRGRIALIRGVGDGKIGVDSPAFLEQMDLCLGCLACQAVCPSGVDYGHLLEAGRAQARAITEKNRLTRWIETLVFQWLFMSMARFRLTARSLWLYQRSGIQWLARKLGLIKAMGLAELEALLPRMDDRFVTPDGTVYAPTGAGIAPKRVALITGCVQSVAFAEVHAATIHALQVNGCEVVLPPGQECCGALHAHSGDLSRSMELARINIDALEGADADYIVVNAAGCSHHMKDYAHALKDDPDYAERAQELVAKTRDITELLAELGPKPPVNSLNWQVTYQDPCHLAHGQKIVSQPRQVLNAIPGLELIEMAESSMCCGSAGTYNILQREMSQRLLDRKMDNTEATGAEVIASANTGCMIQMRSGVKQRGMEARVLHVVEILDAAYRLDEGA
jgi:glycolate oxidase iron-sulfur subunit